MFILTRWLQLDTASFTPFEVTLKTWAAFAGDTRGPLTGHALEAYLHRMATGIPKAMPALERLAHQMVLETDLFPPEKTARGWVKDPTEISEPEDLQHMGMLQLAQGLGLPEASLPQAGLQAGPWALLASLVRPAWPEPSAFMT